MIFEEQFPVPRYTAASKISNSVISLLWQLRCRCNPDHNNFSSSSNTTVVAIFPKLCFWRRSLCSKLRGIDPEKLYRATLIFIWSVLNRPLALGGHVTNSSFKKWVGILLMPKIDKAQKNYLTPEVLEETHLREIFYGTLIFQQNSMTCFGRHVVLEGILLPSNIAAKTTFFLYLVKRLIVSLRCAVNVTTSSFQHFPWSLSAKFVFRKR